MSLGSFDRKTWKNWGCSYHWKIYFPRSCFSFIKNTDNAQCLYHCYLKSISIFNQQIRWSYFNSQRPTWFDGRSDSETQTMHVLQTQSWSGRGCIGFPRWSHWTTRIYLTGWTGVFLQRRLHRQSFRRSRGCETSTTDSLNLHHSASTTIILIYRVTISIG